MGLRRVARNVCWLALLLAWPVTGCSDDASGGDGVGDTDDDLRRRSDIASPTDTGDAGADQPVADTLEESDGVCVPDCAGRVCGLDPVCGAQCGVPCTNGLVCADGSCVPDTSGDPLAALSTECAGFCEALCDFLLDCGKDDPDCLVRCGASPRFQTISTTACTEGAQVIGLEACPLWLDCGGQACAIDAMCLEVLPGVSYQCAPICDHTQAQPACTGGRSCGTVQDAGGQTMGALGMCWSLF